jgi:hypothetical protein
VTSHDVDPRRTHGGRRARCATLAAGALLAGCAHPPPPPTTWDWHARATDPEIAAFRDWRTLLDGRDAARPRESVRPGDRVLFGLCLLDGDERREWFLRVTALTEELPPVPGEPPATIRQWVAGTHSLVLPRPPGRFVRRPVEIRGERLRVEVFDGELAPIADEEIGVTGLLYDGAFHGCQEAVSMVPAPFGRSAAAGARSALFDVFRVIRETPSLLRILREVARLPPLWTFFRGVRVTHDSALDHAVAAVAPEGGPAFAFPLRVLINGTPALLCTVTAAEPVPPLRVCGGFTRLVASDPRDPTRRVVMTLLAARCAPR